MSIELRLANEDEHEIYFDMPFSATPFLSASASKTVLAPGETSAVLPTFSQPEPEPEPEPEPQPQPQPQPQP